MATYRERGVAYYAASALHFGLLGRRFAQYRVAGPDGEWITAADLAAAARVERLAQAAGLPLATLAQRYLFGLAEADRVVIGARTPAQIAATLADWAAGPLPPDLFTAVTAAILSPDQ